MPIQGELPIFKERRMYGSDVNTGKESSYFINESYAGILRLSPNNGATLVEMDSGISITDETKDYINYEDTILPFFETQFLKVSSSDGILLDLRIGQEGVEYDNLYVLGALKTKNIINYIGNKNAFMLDNVKMQTKYNSYADITEGPILQYNEFDATNLNDAYILTNEADDGKETDFVFESASGLINKLVSDALLRLSSLPAGSIHWIPVNIDEYNALMNKGNIHNGSIVGNNTLIRDFLLCDGSQYKIKDFPELAKILNKEKITHWVYNKETNEMEKKIDVEAVPFVNGGDAEGTFRVPDLRTMFIQYVVPSFKNAGEKNNKVGDYEIDSAKNQKIIIDKLTDKHYHYIVLDNTIKSRHNTKNWTKDSNNKYEFHFESAISNSWDEKLLEFNENGGRPLAKYGSMRNASASRGKYGSNMNRTKGCDTRTCRYDGRSIGSDGKLIPSYILPPEDVTSYCHLAGSTCGYILSGSTLPMDEANGSISLNSYIGLSSWNIPMEAKNNKIISERMNYTKSSKYEKEKSYVLYDDSMKNMLGYENAPEFFACLPLIKI